MNFSQLLKLAQSGASHLAAGREALAKVRSAIEDGKAAVSANEQEQLEAMLNTEEAETTSAIVDARNAIAKYRLGK